MDDFTTWLLQKTLGVITKPSVPEPKSQVRFILNVKMFCIKHKCASIQAQVHFSGSVSAFLEDFHSRTARQAVPEYHRNDFYLHAETFYLHDETYSLTYRSVWRCMPKRFHKRTKYCTSNLTFDFLKALTGYYRYSTNKITLSVLPSTLRQAPCGTDGRWDEYGRAL